MQHMPRNTVVEELPSTAETDVGPRLEHQPGQVRLQYDREGEEGPLWVTLEFAGAVAYRFTPEAACDEEMLQAYSRLVIMHDSTWVADLRQASRRIGLPADLQHFAVYFDHSGGVDVLARSATVFSHERNA